MEGAAGEAKAEFSNPLPIVLGKLDDGSYTIVLEVVFTLLRNNVHSGRRNARRKRRIFCNFFRKTSGRNRET